MLARGSLIYIYSAITRSCQTLLRATAELRLSRKVLWDLMWNNLLQSVLSEPFNRFVALMLIGTSVWRLLEGPGMVGLAATEVQA